jgi:hypothetical protein
VGDSFTPETLQQSFQKKRQIVLVAPPVTCVAGLLPPQPAAPVITRRGAPTH